MALLKTFPLDPDVGYGFEWLRGLLEAHLQEGVLNAGDYKATPAAAGGNRVDVAAGIAFIKGDSGVPGLGLTQGLYMQVNDAAILNAVTFRAGDANPRLDQVVLTVNDTSDLGSAGNAPTISIVEGAPTAGATLDNRAGAAALPANSVRILDRLIPAGSNTLVATDLRDRRPWARGAYGIAQYTGADISLNTASYTELSATLSQRIECSGAPLRVRLIGRMIGALNAGTGYLAPWVDAALLAGVGETFAMDNNGNKNVLMDVHAEFAPAAGSHKLSWATRNSGGQTWSWPAGVGSAGLGNPPLTAVVEERLGASANNN